MVHLRSDKQDKIVSYKGQGWVAYDQGLILAYFSPSTGRLSIVPWSFPPL